VIGNKKFIIKRYLFGYMHISSPPVTLKIRKNKKLKSKKESLLKKEIAPFVW